ncbi:Protein FAR1-RELATED SEQUENCE 11, partial [Bienertia sinuspersici]
MLDFDLNEHLIEENDREIDEPFIGQTFANHEEAFVSYNNYAKQHGFVVRKDRLDTRHGKTIKRDLVCHRGGIPKLKTFVGIMKKSPKTITTDQDPWMSEAIAVEMPSTKHSFLYLAYHFKITDPNEFEENWPLSVGKYDLQDNKHIQGRSESINAFIKRFVSSNISLTEFVDIGIEDINQQHIHLNLTASLRPTSLKIKSPLEEQVFGMFTPYAFKKFQQELTRATLYSLIHMEEEILSLDEIIPHSNASVGEVLHPLQSKTKGRPKNKREKGRKEVARKQTKKNLCSGNDTNDGVSQKKQKKSSESLGLNPVFTLK